MMQDALLDFVSDDQLAGFRLHKLQVYNWGTFNNKVKILDLDGQNTLLTGDIGSGKSTLVDAVTTLLVPAHRIAYNKAAGAVGKERTLRSYVMGYYRSIKSELGTKQESLRDHNSYSVILGTFYNEGFDQWVTLAQVFWLKDGQNQPAKLFVVAETPLSIVKDFANFGKDIKQLRKRLQQQEFIKVFDSYLPYSAEFRRHFGIKNEQALELFHQTVSMKQVGNLTDFVREHMLEDFNVAEKITELVNHFNDLNRAYGLVLKAKQQIEWLEPMVANGKKHSKLEKQQQQFISLREGLSGFFSQQKLVLLTKRQQNLSQELTRIANKINTLTSEKQNQQQQRDQLKQAISQEGGDYLAGLQLKITETEVKKVTSQQKFDDYQQLAVKLDLIKPHNSSDFLNNSQILSKLKLEFAEQANEVQNTLTELRVEQSQQNTELKELESELTSLKNRKNNIDARQILIREKLAQALGVDEEELPFVGELLQVHEEQVKWEGAIERILHNFALSLLVPEHLYSKVADWVEQTNLKGRIVYYRVADKQTTPSARLAGNSLVHKVAVKPESVFYNWLKLQLNKRFNYACCENLTEFRREKQALTLQGQIKSANNRHEKDDSRNINDRRFFVLGWSNQQKIQLLEQAASKLLAEIKQQQQFEQRLKQELTKLNLQNEYCIRLTSYKEFSEIDWQSWAKEIARLNAEKQKIEATHNKLKALQRELESLEKFITATENQLDSAKDTKGGCQSKLDDCASEIIITQNNLQEEQQKLAFNNEIAENLANHQQKWQLSLPIKANETQGKEKAMRGKIQTEINKLASKTDSLKDKINAQIKNFRHTYKAETIELLDSIAGLAEYSQLLKQLQQDDLPKFEKKFKEGLNKNIINQVSQFNVSLKKHQQEIKERIEKINLSLVGIDYNPNRYIHLELANNSDQEIKQFYQDLNACVDGSFTDNNDSPYADAKFFKVKDLIDRFEGRDGCLEIDKKWRKKVTDVRNFFLFSASERWREDDVEYEHYSDSAGKSGGQKEKLAYTVLAASLSYQFGLEIGEVKSRSFRFVVIDEAFGRGSDESAKYGLELFKRLNLQLLIITPKQKIHVIEPYVAHVGFVNSVDGRESQLRTLSIEEHLAKKNKYKQLQNKISTIE